MVKPGLWSDPTPAPHNGAVMSVVFRLLIVTQSPYPSNTALHTKLSIGPLGNPPRQYGAQSQDPMFRADHTSSDWWNREFPPICWLRTPCRWWLVQLPQLPSAKGVASRFVLIPSWKLLTTPGRGLWSVACLPAENCHDFQGTPSPDQDHRSCTVSIDWPKGWQIVTRLTHIALSYPPLPSSPARTNAATLYSCYFNWKVYVVLRYSAIRHHVVGEYTSERIEKN